jgi:dihydroneopterin aldolase
MTTTRAVVGFEGRAIHCVIGVLPDERLREQELTVTIQFQVDIQQCAQSDSLHDAVDYTAVASLIDGIAQQGRFHLLETLADRILESVMTTYQTPWVWVKLRKPGAFEGNGVAVVEAERGVRR